MMKKLFALIWLLALSACSEETRDPSGSAFRALVQADDRAEPFEGISWEQDARQTTVALISNEYLVAGDPDDVRVTAPTLVELGFCPSLPFVTQTGAARCSGTLIAPDLVLTSAHCVRDDSACAATSIVFNYAMDTETQARTIGAGDIFACEEVVVRDDTFRASDFAVIRLDRATSRQFAPTVRAPLPREQGTPIATTGHPYGLPLKISAGEVILGEPVDSFGVPEFRDGEFFAHYLDIIHPGSTGGGIRVDLPGPRPVVGLVSSTRGISDPPETDRSRLRYDSTGACYGNPVDAGGPPSRAEYVHQALAELCETVDPVQYGYLCACGDGVCTQAFGENGLTCSTDCGGACGNQWCDPDEDAETCPEDCSSCGDGVCDAAEWRERSSCCEDCGCQEPVTPAEVGDNCNEAISLELGTEPFAVVGDTSVARDVLKCGSGYYCSGPDLVYGFEVTETTTVEATAEGFEYISVHLQRAADCSSPITRDLNNGGREWASVRAQVEPGRYRLVVDGTYRWAKGSFSLTVTGRSPDHNEGTSCLEPIPIDLEEPELERERGLACTQTCPGETRIHRGSQRYYEFELTETTELVAVSDSDEEMCVRRPCGGSVICGNSSLRSVLRPGVYQLTVAHDDVDGAPLAPVSLAFSSEFENIGQFCEDAIRVDGRFETDLRLYPNGRTETYYSFELAEPTTLDRRWLELQAGLLEERAGSSATLFRGGCGGLAAIPWGPTTLQAGTYYLLVRATLEPDYQLLIYETEALGTSCDAPAPLELQTDGRYLASFDRGLRLGGRDSTLYPDCDLRDLPGTTNLRRRYFSMSSDAPHWARLQIESSSGVVAQLSGDAGYWDDSLANGSTCYRESDSIDATLALPAGGVCIRVESRGTYDLTVTPLEPSPATGLLCDDAIQLNLNVPGSQELVPTPSFDVLDVDGIRLCGGENPRRTVYRLEVPEPAVLRGAANVLLSGDGVRPRASIALFAGDCDEDPIALGCPRSSRIATIDQQVEPGVYYVLVDLTDTDLPLPIDVNLELLADACPDDPQKIEPGACGCGVSDESDRDRDGVIDCLDGCPQDRSKTSAGVCGCHIPDIDSDADATLDCNDSCPEDPNKTQPGVCGCHVADVDSDADTTLDCNDSCPQDPNKTEPALCGCGVAEVDTDSDGTPDCEDLCPRDSTKTEPAICGCGATDVDSDADGAADCNDNCPQDPEKTEAGACGCGVVDTDSDDDATPDCDDECPHDAAKDEPGACGCGVADNDSDGDGVPNCTDGCPNDRSSVEPGVCGCGSVETDTDLDGTADCVDACPEDPQKIDAGICGCGISDVDSDGDKTSDCLDECPNDPMKTAPGRCGCGTQDIDSDSDSAPDCLDDCPQDPTKTEAGACGCGVTESDSDGDGVFDCLDQCPQDPLKAGPGRCGCGKSDADSDGDDTPDCEDECPKDSEKQASGACGCNSPDQDSDSDGVYDCDDICPTDESKSQPGICGCGVSDADRDDDGTPDCDDDCPDDAQKVRPGACGCGLSEVDQDDDGTPDCNDLCPLDAATTDDCAPDIPDGPTTPASAADGGCGCAAGPQKGQEYSWLVALIVFGRLRRPRGPSVIR